MGVGNGHVGTTGIVAVRGPVFTKKVTALTLTLILTLNLGPTLPSCRTCMVGPEINALPEGRHQVLGLGLGL